MQRKGKAVIRLLQKRLNVYTEYTVSVELTRNERHGSSYGGQNYMENDQKESENCFELSMVRATARG